MAAYFLDTSTIVKRYAHEIGTAWVQALTAPTGGHLLAVMRVAQAETVAAVTRKERGQLITPQGLLRPPLQISPLISPTNTPSWK